VEEPDDDEIDPEDLEADESFVATPAIEEADAEDQPRKRRRVAPAKKDA
jgi:hypothetical protein